MRESPQETLSRLGPYPRYPDFCTIQVDQRKGGFDPVPRRRERTRKLRKGSLPPSGHRIERGTIDLQSDINCLPERSLLGAFGKQHDDYDHDVFNSAGSTLATPHFGPENGVHLNGLDVEPRVASLSTYLGHVSPTSTYWYLTATPELMALAAKRLERAMEKLP